MGMGLLNQLSLLGNRITNTIPFKSDALFWLDGTLNQAGTAFVDKINGWEFPLSAVYNWERNEKIFPFRTALTLKAPANGTTEATIIKTYDLNSFWYSGVNASALYANYFSNGNIDFEGKCFARVLQRVNNSNGTEKKAAGITDIVHYKTVKTGADLAKCIAYFNAQTEDANAIWVTKTGNNTTGTGTKAKPYLTLTKGCNISADKTVYVKTGRYNEGAFLALPYPVSIVGLGFVEIQNTGSTEVVRITNTATGSTHSFKGLMMGNLNPSDNIITDNATLTSLSFTIQNCMCVQYSKGVYNPTATSCTINTNDNVFTSTRVLISTSGYTINASGSGVLLNNVFGNYISDSAYLGVYGNVKTFKYNKVVSTGSRDYTKTFYSTLRDDVVNSYNIYSNTNTSTSTKTIVGTYGVSSVEVSYNSYYNNSQYGSESVSILGNAALPTNGCHIHHNYIDNYTQQSHVLSVGTEETTADDNSVSNILIEDNTVYGYFYHTPTVEGGATHNIFVGFNANAIIRYNYVNGGGLNYIIKGCLATSGGKMYGNISINPTQVGYFVKGVQNILLYNNTFYNNNTTVRGLYLHAFYYINYNAPDTPDNCITKNNIIVDVSGIASTTLLKLGNLTMNLFTSNNNVMYTSGGVYASSISTGNKTFSEWQALGYDTNSINENVTFYDPSTFKMWLITPKTTGEDLGVTYKDLLDITTDWGSSITPPNIITKKQGDNWQIGAYVQ